MPRQNHTAVDYGSHGGEKVRLFAGLIMDQGGVYLMFRKVVSYEMNQGKV